MRRHCPIEGEDSQARTKTDRAGSALMTGWIERPTRHPLCRQPLEDRI
jgi:hypothetical protein